MEGYIKLYRQLKEKGWYQNSKYLQLWIHLLLSVNHKAKEFMWNNKIILLKAGQIITGRKELAKQTGLNESSVERILNCFENEHQIEQQKTTKYRLITILNWEEYQEVNSKSNNRRTTNEQQMNTNNNVKNDKNDKNIGRFTPPNLEEVKKYCEERQNHVDSQRFIDYYESKGWMIGKNKMKDWKAAVRTWEHSEFNKSEKLDVSERRKL